MKENSRTLYKQYKLEKKNLGGFFGRDEQGNFTNLNKMNSIGSFATGMIGALDPGDENGVQSDIGAGASGAISGAMALAPLGPVGLGVGAVLGGVTSLFGNQKKKEEAEQKQMARNERLADQKADEVQKQIALDPSKLGRNNVSMYKMGGTIMGKPAGKFALQGTTLGNYRAIQSLMPNVSIRPNRLMSNGGAINIDSNGRGEVEGPSHEEGGVKIPELGVELEGEETLDGNFVFSKKLGFADQHKKIMKGIKGTQKDNTPLSIYTRKKLEEKEEMLKVKQEETKKSLGLPNEIDGQQTEEFAIGGSLPKKIYADYLGIPSGVTANTKVTIPTPPSSLNVAGDSSYNLSNTAPTGKSTFDKISDGFEKVTPFISNIANTFRKLPSVPDPILDDTITPLYQDYSASRAEVARGVRGANKVAEQQLASSSATNATRAANLVAGFRATNEINQAQNNANVAIANQTIGQNAEIKRNNNTKLEYKASQDVARSLKQQELNSENLANFTDKLQLQTRDNNLRSLEDDKLMLQIAQDNTGASWRAGKDIFKRRLTPESFKALDEKMSNLEKLSKEERELTIKALQNGLSSLGNSPALNRSPLVEYKKKK